MYIRQTNSTSTLLREQYSDTLPDLYTIRTDYQSAGRGQEGNGWESEDGKNLLFSTLLRTEVQATEQFRLTMLVAVAMREMLAHYLPADRVTIKWPNDIYYGDKKLSGILVENTLIGNRVAYSIVGIGLNVNQQVFASNAPNPVSMRQITDKEYDVAAMLDDYLEVLEKWQTAPAETLRETYLSHLYRRTGLHPYIEREVSLVPTDIAQTADGAFLAEILGITPQGELILHKENGETKAYHFKQIRFVIA